MNGDKKKVQFTDGKTSTTNILFRRKTESLDWKKVASIDVEKVIQSSNLDILEELLSQIAYCRAETEFDSESTDSGLLKVFRLSQLIIESLLHSQEILQEKYDKISSLYGEVEEQKAGYVREIQSLKENLQAAKRELKRRKEIIASTQSEVIGDNKDEFDPCPYCNKKFLTSAYLISHMQRRHQGLPIHPVFPVPPQQVQNIFQGFTPTKYIENSTDALKQFEGGGKTSQLHSPRQKSNNNTNSKYVLHYQVQDTLTQTHKAEVEKLISLETIGALVDQCLKQKENSLKADTLKNQTTNTPVETSRDNQRDGNLIQNVPNSDKPDTKIAEKETDIIHTTINDATKLTEKSDLHETAAKISEEIKNQLDLQWKNLLQKIQESGLGELNKSLNTVPSEPGEIESKSVTPSPRTVRRKSKEKVSLVSKSSASSENEDENRGKNEGKDEQKKESSKISETKIVLEPVVSPIIHINNHLEERLQKQQDELESLKNNLQSRMHEDKLNIESKLESQERYWQNKLRMVEKQYLDEYSGQLAKLREEFHHSLQKLVEKNSTESSPRVESKGIIMADQNKQFHNNNNNSNTNLQNLNANSEKFVGQMTHEDEDEDENFEVDIDYEFSPAKHNMAVRMSNIDSTFQSPKSQQQEENYPDHNMSIEVSSRSPSKQRASSIKITEKLEDQPPLKVLVEQQYQETEFEISKPIAKPRKTATLQSSSSPYLSKTLPTDGVKQDNQNIVVVKAKVASDQHHEYEEPDNVVKLDQVMDYSESESVSHSDEDEVQSGESKKEEGEEETEDEESTKFKKQVTPHRVKNQSINKSSNSPFTIRMLTEEQAALEQRQKMREQCEKELSDQLMSLGYEPGETDQISTKNKNKILKKLKRRRESIKGMDEIKYSKVRERIQEEAEIGVLAKSIKDRLDSSLFTSPVKKSSKSPLVKILSAVKMSKNSWKKSVRSACKRPSKDRKSPVLKIKPPSPPLKVKSKPSIFSKARWRRPKKKKDNKETTAVTTPQRELEKTTAQVIHKNNSSNSVSSSENDDDEEEEVTGGNTSTGESRNSEPEIEKTIFISKKPMMTSTPSNKSPQNKQNQKKLQQNKQHWRDGHEDGITENDDDGSDENSSEYETDEKESQSEQESPLSVSPNVLKKKLKVKNNKASKLRYREAAKKSAAAAMLSKEEKEKLQMNNHGFSPKGFTNPGYGNTEKGPRRTPNQNAKTDDKEKVLIQHDKTQQKSVRRSLEPQFEQVTPHSKTIKITTPNLHNDKNVKGDDSFNSETEESSSSSSSSSSWDDDDDGPKRSQVPNEKLAGEYVSLTPKKYTNNNYHKNNVSTSPTTTRELRSSIKPPTDSTKNSPLYNNKLTIRPSTASTSQQQQNDTYYESNNQKPTTSNTVSRPQTSKRSTRVALDSWDDLSEGENQAEKVEKESQNHNNKTVFDKKKQTAGGEGGGNLISKRWETYNHNHVLYTNGESKRPMPLHTNEVTNLPPSHTDGDNYYKKPSTRVKEQHARPSTGKDSPLNNSWDEE